MCWRNPEAKTKASLGLVETKTQSQVGTPMEQYCQNSTDELLAGLCYPACNIDQGYKPQGALDPATCKKDCPMGYITEPATCRKNPIFDDLITKDADAKQPLCQTGYTAINGLCYKICPEGYERKKDSIDKCTTKCPPGMKDIGSGCERDTNKLVATPLICPKGTDKIGNLCFSKCPDNTERATGSDGLCMTKCPPNTTGNDKECIKAKVTTPSSLLADVGTCPEGKTKRGNLCYQVLL